MRADVRVAILSLGALIGCTRQSSPTVCTALFAYVTLTVHDPQRAAVTGLTISDTVRRTGQTFVMSQFGSLPVGSYVIFDDSHTNLIRATGDSVRVAGSAGGTTFVADFVFDVPGGCHVRKLAGPDTVVTGP